MLQRRLQQQKCNSDCYITSFLIIFHNNSSPPPAATSVTHTLDTRGRWDVGGDGEDRICPAHIIIQVIYHKSSVKYWRVHCFPCLVGLTVWNNANYDKLGNCFWRLCHGQLLLELSALSATSLTVYTLLCCEVVLRGPTIPLSVVSTKFLANLKHFHSKLLFHIWHVGLDGVVSVPFVRVPTCVCAASLFSCPKPTQVTREGLVWVDNSMVTPLLWPSASLFYPSLFPCLSNSMSPKRGWGAW